MIGQALPVYQGYASQYGHGLGNVLGGLVRSALPMVTKFAKSTGTKLLETGLNAVGNAIKRRKPSHTTKSKKKRKVQHVTRTTSHTKPRHKRKMPPGQPNRIPVKQTVRKPRDIFSK
jgi:hypothetical protein